MTFSERIQQLPDRLQLRAYQRARKKEAAKKIMAQSGLPRALFQFAARHGIDAETVINTRKRYSY